MNPKCDSPVEQCSSGLCRTVTLSLSTFTQKLSATAEQALVNSVAEGGEIARGA